jgi:2-C-methyl-D-erythritol 4-phosphate cytidylyltransferase
MQTPQTFHYDIIMKAYEKAMAEGFYGTDDTVLVERMGLSR